ncbi:MAG TPA: CPBP family glutamic-type intramembrane protease [Caulobacterales bacterium]|nr:CPBP family glutamic-type intramembrane protease [Caulobacterales bacterium]
MSATAKAALFLAITFVFSWSAAIGGWALGLRAGLPALLVLTLMMAGPAIAALICAFAFERGRVRAALGLNFKPNWWWLGAWALVLVFAALSVVLTVLLSGRHFVNIGDVIAAQAEAAHRPMAAQLRGQPMLGLIIIGAAAVVGSLINAPILSLTEELGWRGYLHSLWRPSGFWRCSLATGAIWGLWHAPAILLYGLNYPQNREMASAYSPRTARCLRR